MRIAVVHDWLDTWRGGENVLAEILRLYPGAALYSLVDFLSDEVRSRLGGRRANTSFLQHIPGARRHFRLLLPLFPRAIESLDVSAYDLVISSSHSVAKGVRTAAGQVHICYCHTPMRYAWDLRDQYLNGTGPVATVRRALASPILDRLREWDRETSGRVTHFIANSQFIRKRIARCYGRDSNVVYPPVDVKFFTPGDAPIAPSRREHYLTASRWVPYKHVDMIVAAFRELPDRRLVVVGDGPERRRVQRAAGRNVIFTGEVPRHRLRELMRGARAFLFAAEEDFGILPVEAQACGTPVVAYGRGGVLETVRGLDRDAATGTFFPERRPDAVAAAVVDFDGPLRTILPSDCRANAERFATERFRAEFAAVVDGASVCAPAPQGPHL
jgi:glycosyltransferase involved in cell wall biosynthesis